MNKKFLSAILFGALLATTTSTFVSCKDYDDDINGLQEQIDGLKTNLTSEASALRSELASAKTQLESDLAAVESDLAAAKTSLQAAIDAKASASDVAALQTKVSTLETKASTLETKVSTIETKLTEIDLLIADLEAADAANADALSALQAEFEAFEKDVNENLGLLAKTLTSLVLNPDLYYGGIEAVQVSAIEYTEQTTKAVDANKDYRTDAPKDGDEIQMTPMLYATYHMNPSSAVVPTDLGSYNFLIADKEYKPFYGGRALKSEILSATTEAGDLTVTAKFTDGAFAEGDMVTTLALEVEVEEGKVVTSDYAAVYAEKITGFVLDAEQVKGCDQLIYGTAQDAIDADALVTVAWDKTVDLADYIETHYTTEEGCALLPEKTLSGYGFEYKYELVGYFEGDNNTSQSAHAALDGSKLRPQLPSEGEAAAWGDTKQSQATIGRMPLVRVTLVDTNSNKNVAVGYVKVEITATPGDNTVGAKESYTFTEGFTLSCAESLEPLTLKWYEIEESILAQLGISKAEFHNNYKFDAVEGEEEAYGILWDKAPALGIVKEEPKKLTGDIVDAVKVTEAIDAVTGQTTDVLEMTVDANYAYEYFQKKTTITAIVRYAKWTGKDALNKDTYDYVYVTLNWTPSPLNVKPEGTIADSDKIKQYWFADDNHEGGSGYHEIHVNVNVPGEGQDPVSTTNFKKNMLHTFVGDDVTISEVAEVYTDFQDLTTTLVFAENQSTTPLVGTDGKTYVIKRESETQLCAYELISGVPSTTGHKVATIKEDGTIIYNNTVVSKAILNAYGREELKNNVTATILVKETNECGKSLVKLSNNTFDVKFLRPISVKQDPSMDKFKDGVDVGTTGSEVALKLNFTDWRNYAFVDSYFAHYGVQTIEANIAGAETNVSGQWASLPTGMTISYNDGAAFVPTKVGEYGIVKYVNNNAEVGNFKIKVPFTVTYVWGTIEFEVTFDVEKTV